MEHREKNLELTQAEFWAGVPREGCFGSLCLYDVCVLSDW